MGIAYRARAFFQKTGLRGLRRLLQPKVWRSIGRSASLFGSALVNSQMKNSVAPCDRCGNHTAAVYKSLNLNDAGSTTDYNGNRSMA